jgi:amidase
MGAVDPFASATKLLAGLRAGRVSSAELTDLYIQRIERYDGRLNAVVVRDFERARQQARAADQAATRGERAALGVLPITLKESINVIGLETTCGVPEWKGYISAHDGPVAARLRAAGTVLLGKTNVPPALADWQSDNPIYGRTSNPWDTSRTPGGSSGGSAAALAAGLTALEVGSDIGGCVRVPAAVCGVYGQRPSATLVRSGQFPMPPLPNAAVVMGVQGPLARSAEDLDLALSVLAGPDVGEDVAWRVKLPAPRHKRLADFRVAVLPPIPWHPVDGQIEAALEDLASRLGRLGCTVRRAQPEILGDYREQHALYRSLLSAVTSARVDEETRRQRVAMYEKVDDEFSRAHLRGLQGRPGDYIAWNGRREQFRAGWRAFFQEWDVLLAPAINMLAYPHIARAWTTLMQRLDPCQSRRSMAGPVPYLRARVPGAVHGGRPACHRVSGRPLARGPAESGCR